MNCARFFLIEVTPVCIGLAIKMSSSIEGSHSFYMVHLILTIGPQIVFNLRRTFGRTEYCWLSKSVVGKHLCRTWQYEI